MSEAKGGSTSLTILSERSESKGGLTMIETKNQFGEFVANLCQTNIELWHEEDKARVGSDAEIGQAKKNIDKLNQRRNDLIEKIDDVVINHSKQP